MSLSEAASTGPDPRLIEALKSRHPGPTRWIGTHGAWVILSGDTAWKCRRPIRTDLVDLSTAAARRQACEAELVLNRRFEPDVYLGISCLVLDAAGMPKLIDGATPIGDDAACLDWLIRMKRLPSAAFLDRAILAGRVGPGEAASVAEYLYLHYSTLPASSVEPEAHIQRFAHEIELSAHVLGELSPHPPRVLAEFADARRPELEARLRRRALVDGHGDLRPAHFNLGREIRLIDALDCDVQLRQVDPWEELSLLAMMSGELGAAWFGPALAQAFVERAFRSACGISRSEPRSGIERPSQALLAFYTAYHALVRARLAYAHLHQASATRTHHWARRARRFVAIARAGFDGWSALG